jgi:hypothetical protein
MTKAAWTIHAKECPVCKKPFQEDEEVGPIPTCECGTRGKEDQEPPPSPLSRNPKGATYGRSRSAEIAHGRLPISEW